MADFLEKLSSYSSAALGAGSSGRDGVTTPAPLKIEIPEAVVPAPEAPAVPTVPVDTYPLAPVISPEQKRAQDVAQIDDFLSNPIKMALANVSRERGNDLTKGNQILSDRASMSEHDFINKYGDDIYQKVAVLDAGRGHLADLQGGSRSTTEIVTDQLMGAGNGLAQISGSLLTAGLGLDNKD